MLAVGGEARLHDNDGGAEVRLFLSLLPRCQLQSFTSALAGGDNGVPNKKSGHGNDERRRSCGAVRCSLLKKADVIMSVTAYS